MIDAAGAIYVIGGQTSGMYVIVGGSTTCQDVWASTDGGAQARLGRGARRVHWVGTPGVLGAPKGYKGC